MDPATLALTLGLGAASTGINLFGSRKAGKISKSQLKHQEKIAKRKYQENLREIGFREADINRLADKSIRESAETANERGILDSSIRADAEAEINAERQRRLDALQRQRGYMAADLKDQNYMFDLQGRMQDAQRWMEVANGIMGGLTSVDWSKV